MVWGRVIEIRISTIDADGGLHGTILVHGTINTPDGAIRELPFDTHRGQDGLPERGRESTNRYTSIRRCGVNLCARFVMGNPAIGESSTMASWVDVTLLRQ